MLAFLFYLLTQLRSSSSRQPFHFDSGAERCNAFTLEVVLAGRVALDLIQLSGCRERYYQQEGPDNKKCLDSKLREP
jgi:hypothetical protein